MIRRIVFILILPLLISSCGGSAAPTGAPVPAEPSVEQPFVVQNTELPSPTSPSTETSTPAPTPTIILPTPTETLLPPLELPTEAANAPTRMVWDGMPTYLGDSQPGYSFRVTYDPDLWAVTSDQFGFPALGHRGIPYCVVSVTSGRGLPANITVEHDILYTETVTFDVNVAFENSVKKFVTYTGGDGIIFTGCEVSFTEQADQCLENAVTVLSTLKSVPVSQATPQP
jgi:hypothetical protein